MGYLLVHPNGGLHSINTTLIFSNFMVVNTKTAIDADEFRVDHVRYLSGGAYILRFSRNGIKFVPGQYLVMGVEGSRQRREYSIYSGIQDPYLEVLIREVEEGFVSKQLKKAQTGDVLQVEGPRGFFLTQARNDSDASFLFLATGTGIAPYHSFIRSYPGVDYHLVHGIRSMEEAYDMDHYSPGRYHACTSREGGGAYEGRITDFMMDHKLDLSRNIYLCGNGGMIADVMDILFAREFPRHRIFTEAYF